MFSLGFCQLFICLGNTKRKQDLQRECLAKKIIKKYRFRKYAEDFLFEWKTHITVFIFFSVYSSTYSVMLLLWYTQQYVVLLAQVVSFTVKVFMETRCR